MEITLSSQICSWTSPAAARGAGCSTGAAAASSVADLVQMHHDIAFETDDVAAFGDAQAIGGERAVGQLDVDMLVRGDRALGHVDEGLSSAAPHSRSRCAGRCPCADRAAAACCRTGRCGHPGSASIGPPSAPSRAVVEVDMVGVGDVLRRGLGPELVGPLVRREAGHMRRFHRDLGAGDHQIVRVDRQLRQENPEGIEEVETATIEAMARTTVTGTAIRRIRTRRLWRAALANCAASAAS